MASRKIADLHGAFTWDLADFERGTANIENGLKGLLDQARALSDRFRTLGRDMTLALSVPVAGSIAAIGTMSKGSAEEIKALGNSARLAGEDLQRFQRQAHASREVGVEHQKLGDIFKDTREKIGEFAATGGGEMKDFFDNIAPRVDLTAEAFRGLSGKDGLQLYYDALVQAGASQQEIVFYMESIADEASALIPLLERGGKLFREYGESAAVFSEADISALERYRLALRDIGVAMDRIVIAAVKSGLVDLLTRVAETVSEWITKISETNPALLRFAGGVALAAAALGPLLVVLQAVALVVLPLFLARLSPVFLALSVLINPIGTLVVFLGKLSGGFVTVGGVLSGTLSVLGRLALLIARLNPITAALSLVFILFKDDVIGAFSALWDKAQEVLGPALQRLFNAVMKHAETVTESFNRLANSQLGQFIDQLIDLLGDLVGALLEIGGGAVIVAIEFLINIITTITQAVADVVRIVTLLLTGEWSKAWDAAKDAVVNAINNMLPSFTSLFGWIEDALVMLGILEKRQKAATKTGDRAQELIPAGGDDGREDRPRGFLGALPQPPKASRDGGQSRGPSKEDLAAKREEIALEQELAIARERSDFEAIRALEYQRDLARKIAEYEEAGLSATDAKTQAETDLAELAKARRDALQEELRDDVLRAQLQEARIRGDAFAIRTIEEELRYKAEIAELEAKGLESAVAEEIVRRRLLGLEQARADAIAERVRDEELERQIELARIRGDDPADIAALEDEQRLRDRVRELQRDQDLSLQDATTLAMQEASDRSRAYLQGNFRDAFRGGLQAALDGNLKDFFKRWMEDASFNALAKVLDRLADRLADLVFDGSTGGGGGIFDWVGGAFGSLFGSPNSSSGLVAGAGTVGPYSLPAMNNGGSGRFGGLAGIDRNVLSMNGRPFARVSRGEVFDVRPAGQSGQSGFLEVRLRKDGGLEAYMRGIAGKVVEDSAPAIGAASSAAAVAQINQLRDDALE